MHYHFNTKYVLCIILLLGSLIAELAINIAKKNINSVVLYRECERGEEIRKTLLKYVEENRNDSTVTLC